MNTSILLSIGLALLLISIALFIMLLNERRQQRRRLIEERHRTLGLPPGDLVYEDADGQGESLSSSQYPLVGKPDYIVQLPDGRPVPIELKLSVQNVTEPYPNHVVQVGAYCLILEDYFEQPEDMDLALQDFASFVSQRIADVLTAPDVDANTVVAISGLASLFGLTYASAIFETVASSVNGRLLVFFPGQHNGSNYRFLDARDGWNYLAVPITGMEG